MHAGNTRLILLCASCLLPKESIWVELPPDIPGNVARLSTWVLQSLAMSTANVLHQQILPGIVQATY